MLRALVVMIVLTAIAGCGGVDPNSPLGKRKALFKEMMKTSEDMGGMLRGRIKLDEARFAELAEHLDKTSQQPWQYFQPDDNNSKSSAKDELWEKLEQFNQLAREMEQATASMVAATQATKFDEEKIAAQMQQVENACESCHQEFRTY